MLNSIDQQDLEILTTLLLPGIDKNLALNLLSQYNDQPNKLDLIYDQIHQKYQDSYPKEKDKTLKQNVKNRFDSFDTQVSQNYQTNAVNYLSNIYRLIPTDTLSQVLSKFNHHLTPTISFLKKNIVRHPGIFVIKGGIDGVEGTETIIYALDSPHQLVQLSEFLQDALFQEEIAEIERERSELNLIRQQNWIKSEEIYNKREKGEKLFVCCICGYEFLDRETVACSAGHKICCGCLHEQIILNLKESIANNSCIGDEQGLCTEKYPDAALQYVLDPEDYQRFQNIETALILSQLKDTKLLSCPFCNYSEIAPSNVKIDEIITFHCKNPQCGVVSCRKCEKLYHLPDLCPPMKAQKGIQSLRMAVIAAVETILLRGCPGCKTKGMKYYGCNFMTCKQCKTKYCYVCSNPIVEDPPHFDKAPTFCPRYEDSLIEDPRRVREGAEKAVRDWKAQNPDFANLEIDITEFMIK
ncbi:MAG: putative IBR domain family protein [Streblomastix strix]|uniref:Putative IBR domain family protein n=1 Tax=Streblomastix strix TaxID=222440 RepID=A0A5J4VDT4_9EUKA|nr:MAG: putative IBR domain family protein [Streblomastix strix]